MVIPALCGYRFAPDQFTEHERKVAHYDPYQGSQQNGTKQGYGATLEQG